MEKKSHKHKKRELRDTVLRPNLNQFDNVKTDAYRNLKNTEGSWSDLKNAIYHGDNTMLHARKRGKKVHSVIDVAHAFSEDYSR